ncbi:apolipoprotein C-II [Hypomesus transpacificus]|uniref:apolipoprotein C-II n=1 Tax=Hypomesus transpacificus TaxID=137520 RepID=UPI001F0798D6|nr:apolipoprotein C-II [Hypomesus transpacificus]
MNKLLVITVLVALLAINAESFRVARQAEGEIASEFEPEGTHSEVAEEGTHSEVAEEGTHSEVAEEGTHSEVAEEGTLSKISTSVKSYYDSSIDTASGYLDSLRGLKLEEKAKNLYEDTTRAMKTYSGILQDQVYHIFYPQQ